MDQGGACVTKQSHIGYVSHCYDKISGKTSDARKGLFWLTVWGNTVHHGWKEYEMAGHIAATVRKKRDEFWCSQIAYFLSTYIHS